MNSRTGLRRIDLSGRRPASLTRTALAGVLPRASTDVEAAVAQIRALCEDVKHRGAEAVRDYTARFDGVDLATTVVPRQALDDALAGLDPEVRKALEEAVGAPAGSMPHSSQPRKPPRSPRDSPSPAFTSRPAGPASTSPAAWSPIPPRS